MKSGQTDADVSQGDRHLAHALATTVTEDLAEAHTESSRSSGARGFNIALWLPSQGANECPLDPDTSRNTRGPSCFTR
jgi:hypothetical protein